jgi:outer membrane lipoprotein SlyB
MTRASVCALTAVASLTLAGCASSNSADASGASGPARQCFSASSVRNFRAVDSRTVNIRAGRNTFRLDLFGTCPDITWTNGMQLNTRPGSTICTGSGLGVSLTIRGPTGRQNCSVQTVTLLTPEEVAALPARHRP